MGLYQAKRAFNNIPLGFGVRGSIKQLVTYRLRRGNGYYSSKLGELYQDKYGYFIPLSITNTESEPYRKQLKAANLYWKYTLSDSDKAEYNRRAHAFKGLCGNSLFLREAMKGIFSMFVNRGDPSSFDFTLSDFIADDDWHELNLSAVIPTSAHAVLVELEVKATAAGREIIFKNYGNTNAYNIAVGKTQVPNISHIREFTMPVDSDRKMEYFADSAGFSVLNFTVKGWWS